MYIITVLPLLLLSLVLHIRVLSLPFPVHAVETHAITGNSQATSLPTPWVNDTAEYETLFSNPRVDLRLSHPSYKCCTPSDPDRLEKESAASDQQPSPLLVEYDDYVREAKVAPTIDYNTIRSTGEKVSEDMFGDEKCARGEFEKEGFFRGKLGDSRRREFWREEFGRGESVEGKFGTGESGGRRLKRKEFGGEEVEGDDSGGDEFAGGGSFELMVNAGYLLELLSTVNYAFNFYIYVLTAAPFRALLRGLCVCSPAR